MQLLSFDHVNVQTSNLDEMVRWYDEVLGMKTGKRPAFSIPGAWLYLGDKAIVHLVGVDAEPKSIEPKIEHFAINATGMSEFLEMLAGKGIEWELADVPGFGITQVNIRDPDGNHIHIDFMQNESA